MGKMISFRKLLNKDDENPAPPQHNTHASRSLAPLLEGIASTAIRADDSDLSDFQQSIRNLAEAVANSSSPEVVQEEIGRAVRLLETYNRRAQASADAHRKELHSILSLLIDTVAFLSTSSKTSIEQLSSIEENLTSVSNVTELKIIRSKLVACLTMVRTESTRLKLRSEMRVKDLKAAILRASTQILPHVASIPPDPVTGLIGPAAFMEVVSKLIASGKSLTLVAFVFDQLPEMNRRYGRSVADRLLAAGAQRIGTEVSEWGPIFRWNGPAIVLAAEGTPAEMELLTRRIKQMSESRFDLTVDVDGEPTSIRTFFWWTAETLTPEGSVDEVCRSFDRFVAARTNSGN